MKSPSLLNKSESLLLTSLDGLAYIKDSNKKSDNLKLFSVVSVNCDTSEVIRINYSVRAFNNREDEFHKEFDSYNKAVVFYNEMATKWNAYRFDEKVNQ